MALFSKTKKTVQKEAPVIKKAVVKAPVVASGKISVPVDVSAVLVRPHITEKATDGIAKGVYVFDIDPRATKLSVRSAIVKTYAVTPRAVRIVNKKAKAVRNARTGRKGKTSGSKKAYVYLKKGETITVM